MALGLRLLVVAIAFHHTPFDVAVWLRNTGVAVLHHQDPLLGAAEVRVELPAGDAICLCAQALDRPALGAGRQDLPGARRSRHHGAGRITGRTGASGTGALAICRGFAGPRVGPYQRLGLVAVLVALGLIVLVFWSRLDGVELTGALILAFLVVAAGYAIFFYLVFFPGPTIAREQLLVYGSMPVIAAALLALPWERGSGRWF